MHLVDGSRIAVVGGGPAGSFFSYFALDLASRVGLEVELDVYEAKDFHTPGPGGCNNCGGIVSESLVQLLATEGINLPADVVQRGIDSYVLHTDARAVRIETPVNEMRIAAVHRGSGPRRAEFGQWKSFDGHLLDLAQAKGANLIHARVEDIVREGDRVRVQAKGQESRSYDLVVGAAGMHSASLAMFEKLGLEYQPPHSTKTYICEFHLGEEGVSETVGSSMHVFLRNIRGLEFAAVIPKGDCVTVCLMGDEINADLIDRFLDDPDVRSCFPKNWEGQKPLCRCKPRLQMRGAVHPFGDRVVLVGDSGVSRLNKDGIGAAYRTGKAAAVTAVFEGIDAESFRHHFGLECRRIARDNQYGRLVFGVVGILRRFGFCLRGVLRMVDREQTLPGGDQRAMSMVLWDSFTGSAPYRDIFYRAVRPAFLARLFLEIARGLIPFRRPTHPPSTRTMSH